MAATRKTKPARKIAARPAKKSRPAKRKAAKRKVAAPKRNPAKPAARKAAPKSPPPGPPPGPPPVWRATIADMLGRLPTPAGKRSDTAFTHGTLEVKLYAPRGHDPQVPHDRDEVYVVIYGTGVFANGGQRQAFRPGDLLFVPAHVEHRFEEFTDDAVIWVVFYGPRGGERP